MITDVLVYQAHCMKGSSKKRTFAGKKRTFAGLTDAILINGHPQHEGIIAYH